MGKIIERNDNENTPSVMVGDRESEVSIKIYQDVYNQITGRSEQIKKRYSENLLIDFEEVQQLHYKIMQLCDVHKVIAKNEVVSIFHEKERKEQFTSFERFKSYNANASSPSVNFVLKYNFSIIPADLKRPQEYVITIRLISRVAVMKEIERDLPPFLKGRMFGAMASNTAEITVDYVDYIIARGFLEAFDEWIQGCKTSPSKPFIDFLQRWSYFIPKTCKSSAVLIITLFALETASHIFTQQISPEIWVRFFIVFISGLSLLALFMESAGRMIENTIDSYSELSYLKFNKGDNNLIEMFCKKRKRIIFKFAFGCIITIILGVISSKLSIFI